MTRFFKEGFHSHEFVISAANGTISQTGGVVTAPVGGLDTGTILGRLANGNYVALDLAASTGAEVFAGILLNDALEGDNDNAIFARHGEVTEGRIIFPDGSSAANITAIKLAMEDKDIFVRATAREIE